MDSADLPQLEALPPNNQNDDNDEDEDTFAVKIHNPKPKRNLKIKVPPGQIELGSQLQPPPTESEKKLAKFNK